MVIFHLSLECHVGLWILLRWIHHLLVALLTAVTDKRWDKDECWMFLFSSHRKEGGIVWLVFEKKRSKYTKLGEKKKVWDLSCNDVMIKTQGKHQPGSQTVVDEQKKRQHWVRYQKTTVFQFHDFFCNGKITQQMRTQFQDLFLLEEWQIRQMNRWVRYWRWD